MQAKTTPMQIFQRWFLRRGNIFRYLWLCSLPSPSPLALHRRFESWNTSWSCHTPAMGAIVCPCHLHNIHLHEQLVRFSATDDSITGWCSRFYRHILNTQSGNPPSDPPETTYVKELVKWIVNFNNQVYIFNNEPFYRDIYNPHMWSIAIEFRGSVIIYIIMLMSHALIGYGHGPRVLAEASIIVYFLFAFDE